MKPIHRSILTRALLTSVALLVPTMMGTAGVRADTVGGAAGTPGAFCDDPSEYCDINGGDGESVFAGGNPAVAIGGNGGAGGGGGNGNGDGTGNGGNGGSATAGATGGSIVSASATGGSGGANLSYGGNGGDANATSNALSGSAVASSSAYATGGFAPLGGNGGSATATADAVATKGGLATSEAVATGGRFGFLGEFPGGANATSTAKSTFAVAGVQSTDEATVNIVMLSGKAIPDSGVATAGAVAQAGGAGHAFVKPDNSAYAISTVLPNKADVATLIGGASNVASAFLPPRDVVFGTAILGNNDFPDGLVDSFTYSESSTFDFAYRGDLLLGVIDGDFSVIINGVQVLAEEYVDDGVIDLGSSFGPNIDLTIVSSWGVFVLGGAVPEPSTWAMVLVGFAGLGFAGHRSAGQRGSVSCG